MIKKSLLKGGIIVCALAMSVNTNAQKADAVRDMANGVMDSKANPQNHVQTMKGALDRHNSIAAEGRTVEEGFEGDFLPSCWTSIDADGDGQDWFSYNAAGSAFEGEFSAASASWLGGVGPLTPDNYLVSPQLSVGTDEMLTFYIGAQDPSWPAENYGVYVSTTGNAEADFTDELWVETLTDGEWQFRELDMSEYAGQDIYIAFRHFDVTDQFYIKLDQVVLPGTAAECFDCSTVVFPSVEAESIICSEDGTGWFLNLDLDGGEGTFTFSNSANGDEVTIDGFTIVEAGPFANAQNVTFTITYDAEASCTVSFSGTANCTEPCEENALGPWNDFNTAGIPVPDAQGVCDVVTITDFEIWAGEAYTLNEMPADVMYTFNACEGPGAGSWDITYTVLGPDGEVVAFGTDADACSITWTTETAGDYLLIITRVGFCGIGFQIDNGYPELTCSGITSTIDRVVVDAKLYPNPAQNQINVATPLQGDAQVRIFDIAGRLIAQRNINLNGVNFIQDISSLDKGMYSMEITTSDRIATEKFIKQ